MKRRLTTVLATARGLRGSPQVERLGQKAARLFVEAARLPATSGARHDDDQFVTRRPPATLSRGVRSLN